jgi:hypothetical protein
MCTLEQEWRKSGYVFSYFGYVRLLNINLYYICCNFEVTGGCRHGTVIKCHHWAAAMTSMVCVPKIIAVKSAIPEQLLSG